MEIKIKKNKIKVATGYFMEPSTINKVKKYAAKNNLANQIAAEKLILEALQYEK